jgi:hypothetical protein
MRFRFLDSRSGSNYLSLFECGGSSGVYASGEMAGNSRELNTMAFHKCGYFMKNMKSLAEKSHENHEK